jgi:hypothetical protein
VIGRYCHACGQENVEPRQTLWHLIAHFFNDITHFDGKFFETLKVLLFRPGFLPAEYIRGRRVRYLDPIRMYVFTSAIFFLLFFSFFQHDHPFRATINGKTLDEVRSLDSASFAKFTADLTDGKKPLTREQFEKFVDTSLSKGLRIGSASYSTVREYDSVMRARNRKPGWFERQFAYKQIAINQKYHNNMQEITSAFTHSLVHSIPQMLFISLPLFAFILRILYVRRRKEFYYVSHGIFAVHLYIFIFIALLVVLSLGKLDDVVHSGLLRALGSLLVIGMIVYVYLAMKKFYHQGWLKTFFKFLLTGLGLVIVIPLLFCVFIFFSFFNI